MSRPFEVVAALTRVSRGFHAHRDVEATLDGLVSVLRDATADGVHVGLSVRGPGVDARTVAGDDDLVIGLASLQSDPREGPWLAVLEAGAPVRVDDLGTEPRWSRFTRRAVELGVHSYVGVRLLVDEGTAGVLSVYATGAAPSDEVVEVAELVAAHAALVLGHSRQVDNLTAALQSRKVIGLALGMLMQRLDLDEDTAFAYLTRVSATSETKLRDVATAMVREHEERLAAGRP